jgi:glycosyltransferase involved in cell wall biosynthesis
MTSFIVPAWNEAGLIGATIDAIQSACRTLNEPCEIIVADDGSTDETAVIAARHGARVVKVSHRQIAATRNSGARVATGESFIFVDADTIVNATVVGLALDAMRKGAVGGGAAVSLDPHVPWYAKAIMPFFVLGFRIAGVAAGCFLFCTRSAFEAVGGFDETYFSAEEIIMSRALKRQGRFVVLKHTVLTSGRKLRTHSVAEVWVFMIRLALRGPKGVRQRQGMDLWYAERRRDPKDPNGGRVFRPGESAGPEGPAPED